MSLFYHFGTFYASTYLGHYHVRMIIVNVYGSIGFTNYGYIDKMKPGILAKLDSHEGKHVHTFMDDIVGAIAAAAASRLAHANPTKSDLVK